MTRHTTTRAGEPRVPTGSENRRRFKITCSLMGSVIVIGLVLLVGAVLAAPDVWMRFWSAAVVLLVGFQRHLGTALGWYFGRSRHED